MTNFEIFTNIVINELTKMAKGAEIQLHEVSKNNDVIMHGLTFRGEVNISPIIYIDEYYEQYQRGRDIAGIITDIARIYEDNKVEQTIDVSSFMDFERVKSKMICTLVNYERNKRLLGDIPHINVLDLSIIFRVLIETGENGMASILVHNEHLDIWNMNVQSLYEIATDNTAKLLEPDLKSMGAVLREMFDCKEAAGEMEKAVPLYVLTNKLKMYGAGCIFYDNLLKDFSEKVGADLYILPSSIHEVILVPALEGSDKGQLAEMVHEVNVTQLSPEEILSDTVYYYDREKCKIVM